MASILALKAGGVSYRAQAAHLGVNDSLIGQIARGVKPGRNLEDRAAALAGRLTPAGLPAEVGPLPEVTRRVQRVRQAVRRGGNRWATASVKRQGTASGAHALQSMVEDSAVLGRKVALRLDLSARVKLGQSAGRRVKHRRGAASQEARIGDGGRGIDAGTLAQLVTEHDGNVRNAVASYLVAHGYAESIDPADIHGIEVSSWD